MLLSAIKRTLPLFISLILLIFLVIWLWQRQPAIQKEEVLSQKSPNPESQNPADGKKSAEFPDNIVSSEESIKFKGKTKPKDFIVITSNSASLIVPSDNSGNFEVNVKLSNGLNLIDYLTISDSLKEIQQKSLTFYFDKSQKSKTVFAGTVKNIFDTLITLSTSGGDINIRSSQETKIDLPQAEDDKKNTQTDPPIKNIRVGDFAVSLGNLSDKNTQIAQQIIISRTNKPQNLSQVITAQVALSLKNNFFTVKNLRDSKIVELNLTKDSQIHTENPTPSPTPKSSAKNQPANISEIINDKTAIIVYHAQDEKLIVDLILLLP